MTKRALLREEVVLDSESYLTSILPSWKKRICRGCFAAHSSRLSIKCAHPRSPQSSSSNILPCRHLLFLSWVPKIIVCKYSALMLACIPKLLCSH